MTARVILWRHGQTDYNLQMRVQGQVDIPLNETGLAQAAAAAEVLAGEAPAKIYASGLSRAQATAKLLAAKLGLEVQTEPRLMERNFGKWEGLTRAEIEAGWPNEYIVWREWGDPSPEVEVEPRREVGERVAAAVRELAAREADGTTIVCVSHGSAITQGTSALLGQDASEWYGLRGLDNCGWTILTPTLREPGWALSCYNRHA